MSIWTFHGVSGDQWCLAPSLVCLDSLLLCLLQVEPSVVPLLTSLNVHCLQVRMKPGKPLTFATLEVEAGGGQPPRRVYVFGLPGNPVSSIVTFHLVVVPAIRKMKGWKVGWDAVVVL